MLVSKIVLFLSKLQFGLLEMLPAHENSLLSVWSNVTFNQLKWDDPKWTFRVKFDKLFQKPVQVTNLVDIVPCYFPVRTPNLTAAENVSQLQNSIMNVSIKSSFVPPHNTQHHFTADIVQVHQERLSSSTARNCVSRSELVRHLHCSPDHRRCSLQEIFM